MVNYDVVNPTNASENGVLGVPQYGVVYIDVGKEYVIELDFMLHDHILKWLCVEVSKLNFGIVIGWSDFGSERKLTFDTMICEKNGEYKEYVSKLKYDDTRISKY